MIQTLFLIIVSYLVLQYLFTLYYYKKGKKLSETVFTEDITIKTSAKKQLKILVSGDSVGAGVGASSKDKTIPARLAKVVSKKYSVSIKNESVPGNRVHDMLLHEVNQQYDIAILVISSNDLFHFTSIPAFKKQIKKLLKKYSKVASQVVILGPLRVDTCTAVPFFLRIIYYVRGKKYLNIVRNESKKYKNIMHTSSYYLKSTKTYGHIEGSDRFHPNDQGYRMYTDLILSKVKL